MNWRHGLLMTGIFACVGMAIGCPAKTPSDAPDTGVVAQADSPPGGSAASAGSMPSGHSTSSVAVDLEAFFGMPKFEGDVVAKVNEEIITRKDLENRLRQTQVQLVATGLPQGLSRYDVLDGAIDDLVDGKLEIVLAEKLGAKIDPAHVEEFLVQLEQRMNQNAAFKTFLLRAGKDEAQRRIDAVEAVRRRAIVGKLKEKAGKEIETAARAHYEKHKRDYLEKGGVQTWRIVIKAPRGMMQRDRDAARARAKDLHAKAAKDPDNFENLAKSHSEGGKRMQGGYIGYVSKGQYHEAFEKAVYAGKPGSILALQEDPQGFQIVKIGERREGRTIPFEERQAEITDRVFGTIIRNMVRDELDALRKKQKIEIMIPELHELEAKRKAATN